AVINDSVFSAAPSVLGFIVDQTQGHSSHPQEISIPLHPVADSPGVGWSRALHRGHDPCWDAEQESVDQFFNRHRNAEGLLERGIVLAQELVGMIASVIEQDFPPVSH